MTDGTNRLSSFKAWLVIGLIVVVIAAITGILAFTGNKKECDCLPTGWQIVRPPEFTLALAEQGDYLWAGSLDGLFAIDRVTGELVPSLSSGAPSMTYINDILVDRDGVLWIGHWGGLVSLKDGEWETYTESDILPAGPVKSLYEDDNGVLWIGTENGVVRFDGVEWRHFSTEDGLELDVIDVIFQDRDGVFWFGSASLTKGGLSRYDGESWQTYTVKEGLAHNSVNDIIQDRSGALWIATGFGGAGGANKLENGQWTTLTKKDGLDGNLWFGSEYDGVAVNVSGDWKVLTPQVGLAGWEVLEIVQDSDGVIWIATENGVSRIESVDFALAVE
jgi:ligand-binding sensor domain-containing protein